VPLTKSSQHTFWALLCILRNVPQIKYAFIVGIYYGKSEYAKPSNVGEFLGPFVDEMEILLKNGLSHADSLLKISIRCFILDVPARSMVKGVVGHSGYYACHNCITCGSFKGKRKEKRETNEMFRKRLNKYHHHVTSPIKRLNIDMINQFLQDYLHLICLRVVTKLITL
jgi:hypothetical protein